MATAISSSLATIISLLLASFSLPSKSVAGGIAVCWGQNGNEGSLTDTCNSGKYAYVIIVSLAVFGDGQTPVLDLAGHCDPDSGACKGISAGIRACQGRGIKVMLSLGGGAWGYTLSSADDARDVAQYLWNNFFGGSSPNRPLGDAALDGVNLDIEAGGGAQFYAYLASRLAELGQQGGRKVYLSASPQCTFPDPHLHAAIDTGILDYVWVQFCSDPQCECVAGNLQGFKDTWNKWTSIEAGKVFVGLPASQSAGASNGYVCPRTLAGQVLPFVKQSSKYGGIMLWDRFNDIQSGYSSRVLGSV